MKKLLSLFLAILMVFSVAACSSGGGGKDDDKKTKLRVGAYNGGYGDAWMYELKERFEKAYENYSFEEGKTGVVVDIHDDNTVYNGDYLVNNIDSIQAEVIFTLVANYGTLVEQGRIRNISSLVKQSLRDITGGVETRSIEDKISQEYKDYLTCYDGEYYAIPHNDGLMGINYNVDMFESRLWYFSADPNDADGFINSLSDKRSTGPNGVFDYDAEHPEIVTDDGLPATYEEFYKLCQKIENSNEIVPLTWAGNAVQYTTIALASMAEDDMGAENVKRIYDSKGALTNTVIGGDLNNLESTTIDYKDGYKVYQNKAVYNALSFFEKIIDEGWYFTPEKSNGVDSLNFSNAYTHLQAQADFVLSGHRTTGRQVAMLVEGSYWQSEAKTAFDMLKNFGSGKYQARYAFMPFPKSSQDKVGQPLTAAVGGTSYAFINDNIADGKVEVAEKFLQFAYTNDSLANYTIQSGCTKNVDYSLTDAQYDNLSYFEKSIWTTRANAVMLPSVSTSPLFKNKSARFSFYLNLTADLKVDNKDKSYLNPVGAFRDGVSAKDYFDAIGKKQTETSWKNTFSSELNALNN